MTPCHFNYTFFSVKHPTVQAHEKHQGHTTSHLSSGRAIVITLLFPVEAAGTPGFPSSALFFYPPLYLLLPLLESDAESRPSSDVLPLPDKDKRYDGHEQAQTPEETARPRYPQSEEHRGGGEG